MRELLVDRWGQAVAPDGRVDRDKVAERVFGRPDELAWLESQLHPRVGARMAAWKEEVEGKADVAVVEVPLLFETKMEKAFDAVIAVTANDANRQQRLAERDWSDIEGREARQIDQAEKAKRADYAVANDGSLEDLERELGEILDRLPGERNGQVS